MNTARIVVLTIAVGAGGIAAYLASGSDDKPPPAEPVAQLQTVDVLVAKSDIGLGQTVTPEDMQWQTWPAATREQHLHPPQRTARRDHPDRRLDRALALHRRRADPRAEAGQGQRLRLHGRDPAHRHARRLDRNLAGNRRRRLHPAQRPGRRHSLEAREESATVPGAPDVVNSEIILSNIRVLAIDQAPKEKDGQNAVVGKTVTLELKPEQAETLARARQTGTLSLALRSIAEVNMVENRADDQALEAGRNHQCGSLRHLKARRRHRSDRKDARYEMQGKSAGDADLSGPRPVVFGRRGADAQSGADARGGGRLSRARRPSLPTAR